jgi:hypothetical protein
MVAYWLSDGFRDDPYWSNVAKTPSASKGERAIAQAVNTLHGILLSKKEEQLEWDNAELLLVKSVRI